MYYEMHKYYNYKEEYSKFVFCFHNFLIHHSSILKKFEKQRIFIFNYAEYYITDMHNVTYSWILIWRFNKFFLFILLETGLFMLTFTILRT